MRIDLCASDDHETTSRLVKAIASVGGRVEGEDEFMGVGLHRFLCPGGEVSVFVDAWSVDLAGPDELVRQILAALSSVD